MQAYKLGRKCAKCGVSSNGSTRSFHSFPRPTGNNLPKSLAWAQWVYPEENWTDEKLMALYKKNRVICSDHFLYTDFTDHSGRHLNRYAKPSINLSSPSKIAPSSPTASNEITSTVTHQGIPSVDITRISPSISGNVTASAEPENPSATEPSAETFPSSSSPTPTSSSTFLPSAPPSSTLPTPTPQILSPLPSTPPRSSFHPTTLSPRTPSTPLSQMAAICTTPKPLPRTIRSAGTVNPSTPKRRKRASGHRKPAKTLLKIIDATRVANLSPRKQKYYHICKKQDKEIKRLRQKCAKYSPRQILTELNESAAVNELCQKLKPVANVLLRSQLRTAGCKPKGRRWNLDEKLLALTLYKKSPTCYRFMQHLFTLPSQTTLTNLLSSIPLNPGVSEELLTTLAESVKKMDERDRVCSVTFDEMSMRCSLSYNVKLDLIEGYEDHGEQGRSSKIAKSALVFQVQGLRKKYKQPVAYYLSGNNASGARIQVLLKNVLRKVFSIQLKVVATVCDLGSNNAKAVKGLKKNPLIDCYFEFEGHKIAVIFDPPHLLNCTRNMLMKHNLTVTIDTELYDESDKAQSVEGVVKWEHIEKMWEEEKKKNRTRCVPKLTDAHIKPMMRQTMKVKLAAQVLSHTVGSTLLTYVKDGKISDALPAASFCYEMDNLFDSVNGYTAHLADGKPYKTIITKKSPPLEFWAEEKKKISKWKFDNVDPPSRRGWIQTLNAIELVWKMVQELGFTYLEPRSLNQDALENLYGVIRALCGGNANPTTPQLIGALKTAIINDVVYHDVKKMNCEADGGHFLNNLRTLLAQNPDSSKSTSNSGTDTAEPQGDTYEVMYKEKLQAAQRRNETKNPNHLSIGCSETLSLAYVAGFIAGNILDRTECETCAKVMLSDSCQFFNRFIKFKEFNKKKESLDYPSENMVIAVGECATTIENFLDKSGHVSKLKVCVTTAIHENPKVNFSWLTCCKTHFQTNVETIMNDAFFIWVKWWCTKKNRAMKDERRENKKKLNNLQNR